MSESDSLVSESLQSGEFGPLLDWLEEHGCLQLKKRIAHMLALGETRWVTNVYLHQIQNDASPSELEEQARQANQLLGH